MGSIPSVYPQIPYFGAGPCAKPPGWDSSHLKNAFTARSHRSEPGIKRIQEILTLLRSVLEIPETYKIAIISGSATAAVEACLWNLLGKRSVQVHIWDIFGQRWANDIKNSLKIKDVNLFGLNSNSLPQLDKTNFEQDVVFTINASTSGILALDTSWINNDRQGLVICDATSLAFAVPLPWETLDATAFSFQKGLGGEAGLGVVVLSPKALKRVEKYIPTWPIPYLLRLTTETGEINNKLFEGYLLNTPSMLLIEDTLYALKWAKAIGGQKILYQRTRQNYKVIKEWLKTISWSQFLVHSEEFRSTTTVCLKIIEPWFKKLTHEHQWQMIKQFCALLGEHNVAFDIQNHILGEPSLRIWCGPTIETTDLEKLMPWLEWAYDKIKNEKAFK